MESEIYYHYFHVQIYNLYSFFVAFIHTFISHPLSTSNAMKEWTYKLSLPIEEEKLIHLAEMPTSTDFP